MVCRIEVSLWIVDMFCGKYSIRVCYLSLDGCVILKEVGKVIVMYFDFLRR